MYEKTEWKARKGSSLNRFEKSSETNNAVILNNTPSLVTEPGTPFSTANMNKIEQGIYDAHEMAAQEEQSRIDSIQAHDTNTTAHADIRGIIQTLTGLPAWDSNSHIITFQAIDGSTLTVDLPLEDLAKNIDFDPSTKEIIVIKHDGSQIRISVSDLVDVYTGSLGGHIQVTVGEDNQIHAVLRGGSITENELAAGLLHTLVRTTGAQAVSGEKTFSEIPVLPISNPTTDNQAARKGYVDGQVTSRIPVSEKGEANGVATLDAAGLVPISQLPSGIGGGGGETGGSGKKYATLVIGNTGAGHTENDVDYLCTGTDDDVLINQAIQALPEGGGKILILEGQYNLGGSVVVDRANVWLQGMGKATKLNATVNIINTGLVIVFKDYCKIDSLFITNEADVEVYYGIYAASKTGIRDIKIINNTVANVSNTINATFGIMVSRCHNMLIMGNTIANVGSNSGGINLNNASNSLIMGNTTANVGSNSEAYYTAGCCGISLAGSEGCSNKIINNNIANTSKGNSRSVGISVANDQSSIIGNSINNASDSTLADSAFANEHTCYGIAISAREVTIMGNTIANVGKCESGKCVGLFLDKYCALITVTGNIIANVGHNVSSGNNAVKSVGIYVESKATISGNSIRNGMYPSRNSNNTWAFQFPYSPYGYNYLSITANDMSGVMDVSSPGAVYTNNCLASVPPLPGLTTVGWGEASGSFIVGGNII